MAVALLIAICSVCFAAPPPEKNTVDKPPTEKNVTPSAKGMIGRMGDSINRVGSIQAGPAAVAAQALMGVPENDAGKFHIIVLTSSDPRASVACDKLLNDINTDPKFADWINRDEPAKSWSHYQVRSFEDPLQKHYIDGVRTLLFPVDADGNPVALQDPKGDKVAPFPAIIVKPPLDGRYGQNDAVVTMINGYSGDVEEVCGRIRTAVDQWCPRHASGLISQANAGLITAPREYPSPFATPPTAVDPFEPTAIRQWPEKRFNQPAAPVPLTAKQITAAIPDAPADFLLQQLIQEPTDIVAVKLAWLDHREQALQQLQSKQTPAVNQTFDPPDCPVPSTNESQADPANFPQGELSSDAEETPAESTESSPLTVTNCLLLCLLVGVGYLAQLLRSGSKHTLTVNTGESKSSSTDAS